MRLRKRRETERKTHKYRWETAAEWDGKRLLENVQKRYHTRKQSESTKTTNTTYTTV